MFTLIQLGNRIGALSTLFYVFATFMLGLTLLRLQGQGILSKLQASAGTPMVSAQMIGGELAMGLAGLLLIIPGLITDSLAIPIAFFSLLSKRKTAPEHPQGRDSAAHFGADDSIEGEFRRLDDD